MSKILSEIPVSNGSPSQMLDQIENFMVGSCRALRTISNPSAKTTNFSQMSQPQKKRKQNMKEGPGIEGGSTENAQQQLHGALSERTCQHNPPFTINVWWGW